MTAKGQFNEIKSVAEKFGIKSLSSSVLKTIDLSNIYILDFEVAHLNSETIDKKSVVK